MTRIRPLAATVLAVLVAASCSCAAGGDDARGTGPRSDANASPDNTGNVLVGDGQSLLPEHKGKPYVTPVRQPTNELIARLKVPEGFRVRVWRAGWDASA